MMQIESALLAFSGFMCSNPDSQAPSRAGTAAADAPAVAAPSDGASAGG